MRRFSFAKLNWKYVIGEVLPIFIGIKLTIWFNNWINNSKVTTTPYLKISEAATKYTEAGWNYKPN
ncbi:MAG: hypothetical protein AAF361_01100 [Bacteroidota bacterium]